MWYEMKREFIEAAARVMWASAWVGSLEKGLKRLRMDDPPPTPDYARLEAAILLGKLEQANGCGLAVIVKAASDADIAARVAGADIPPYPFGDAYVRAFASAVALEALRTGVSWFDDHEAFTLPHMHISDCEDSGCNLDVQPFVVPSIEFTYEESEHA